MSLDLWEECESIEFCVDANGYLLCIPDLSRRSIKCALFNRRDGAITNNLKHHHDFGSQQRTPTTAARRLSQTKVEWILCSIHTHFFRHIYVIDGRTVVNHDAPCHPPSP